MNPHNIHITNLARSLNQLLALPSERSSLGLGAHLRHLDYVTLLTALVPQLGRACAVVETLQRVAAVSGALKDDLVAGHAFGFDGVLVLLVMFKVT